MNPVRRSLVSLAVILVAALATVAAWRLRPPPPPPPGADLQRVLPFAADQVARIAVRGADATLDATRSAGGWRVEKLRVGDVERSIASLPPPAEVSAVIGDLVEEVVAVPEIDRFPLGEQDPASFGLRNPRWRIDVTVADGEVWTLQLGGGNVAGTSLYATLEDTRETSRAAATPEVRQLGTLLLSRIDAALRRLAAPAVSPGGAP